MSGFPFGPPGGWAEVEMPMDDRSLVGFVLSMRRRAAARHWVRILADDRDGLGSDGIGLAGGDWLRMGDSDRVGMGWGAVGSEFLGGSVVGFGF